MDKSLDRFLEGQLKKEATPEHIAEEMVALIPDEIIQNLDSKYLDINCKTGVFPIKIRDRLMRENKKLIEMFPAGQERERRKYIDEHCKIFGISWIKEYANRSRANIYGKATIKGKIYYVPEVKNKNGKIEPAYKTLIAAKDNGKLLNDTIKEICDMQFETDMSFDVVIGNPPYNDDMYLDFVRLGHRLSKHITSMITPAKFQCKQDDINESFRSDIVPYISELTFYPSCSDIFEIKTVDGIAWYIIGKTVNNDINVHNRCIYQKLLESDEIRSITGDTSLLNAFNSIDKKLSNYSKFKISNLRKNGKYMVYGNGNFSGSRGKPGMYQAIGTIAYATGKAAVIGSLSVDENDDITRATMTTADKVWYTSDDKNNCYSFYSWLNTKFVQFCLFGWLSTRTLCNDGSFGKVPNPGEFDRIFEDKPLVGYTPDENGEYTDDKGIKHCALFYKYKLSEDEMELISNIIK